MRRRLLVLLIAVGTVRGTRAETGLTNVVADGDISNTLNLVVGNSGPFNALLITNAAVV